MQTDISKLDIQALKAMAFDEIGQIQLHQQNLSILNSRIDDLVKEQNKTKQPAVVEKKEK